MIKITDVADKAGVAKSTVSNVLTGNKYVSDRLRKKVLDACKELNFKPNFYASALSSGKPKIIALLLEATPEIRNYPFYKDFILSCLLQAAEKGYSLLCYYDLDNDRLVENLRQGKAPIAGAIMLAPNFNDQRLAEMENNRTVCVVIGRPSLPEFGFVDVNNKQLVIDVTSRLIDMYGKDVYLINSEDSKTISQDRLEGFSEVCERYGINPEEHVYKCNGDSMDESYRFAIEHMKKDSIFITANETRAKGVYKAACEKKFLVGRDVAVFSLGRSIEHGEFFPRLSYASQNYDTIGKLAVEALIKEIETGERSEILVDSEVNFRESTCRY